MLWQYIFTMPALVAGSVLVLCLLHPSRPEVTSPLWLILVGFGGLASLLAIVYGGRSVVITATGPSLSFYKPYALFTRQQTIDLRTVQTVYLTGIRFQEKCFSFFGFRKEERALLTVYVVPLREEDLVTLAAFLHSHAITTNF